MKIKDLGEFTRLLAAARAIVDGDVLALERLRSRGLDVNAPIKLDRYVSIEPLELAIRLKRRRVIDCLIAHGANLSSKESPSIVAAARYGDEKLLRKLVAAGANVHAVSCVRTDAFEAALQGKRHRNLPVLEALGHTAKKYGGPAFRSAVLSGDDVAVTFFLKHGVDLDHRKPDQVFPNRETPLCVAARNGDLPMVRRLVEAGADLALTDRGGQRPYDIAVERNDDELRAYIRSVEPARLHDEPARLRALSAYALPSSAVALMKPGARRIELPDSPFLSSSSTPSRTQCRWCSSARNYCASRA
ncbi:MAG: ankyrin repeat domain-containing protein [Labilithrix sp.]|nr:ankyrin repeat domain-containing protein [Labilithrix sp.]MCW5816680.1 ankyrin repeat domain-containing protein [Labilithrix sp.]